MAERRVRIRACFWRAENPTPKEGPRPEMDFDCAPQPANYGTTVTELKRIFQENENER
jgi:hypothetical protein